MTPATTPATTPTPRPSRHEKPQPCRCRAYRFPHRFGGGACSDGTDDDGTCHACTGTGEGMWDGTSCGSCNGRGGFGPGWGSSWTSRRRDVDD